MEVMPLAAKRKCVTFIGQVSVAINVFFILHKFHTVIMSSTVCDEQADSYNVQWFIYGPFMHIKINIVVKKFINGKEYRLLQFDELENLNDI